ncbi:MAG TPA: TatD family hydrolase [Candidatus Dormibacteraeota bacterium]|nr:TatD family hydrolase [Candidatus Dormibacteraeota bacterium]
MTEGQLALIDSHCHLVELERRGVAPAAAVSEAGRAGVSQMVTGGDDLAESRAGMALAEEYAEVFFTVGWHPVNPRPPEAAELAEMRRLLAHPKAVAVGEIGLDYLFRPGHLETAPEVQRESFSRMLELAAEVAKPVVIHQRQAQRDLLSVLDSGPPVTGILHCFSGDARFAADAAARGLYCSFAGNVTFKSAHQLREAARAVPAELLLVETDAPFLAPDPHRGETCQPSMVRATAQWLAALRGDCLESVAAITTENARRALGIPVP